MATKATTSRVEIDRTGDPVDAVVSSATAIRSAGWWQVVGVAEHWPLTDAEAEAMLRDAGQFDLADGELAGLVEQQILRAPAAPDEWNAADILDAGFVLEQRRQWRPMPSAHDGKRSPQEIIFQKAVEEGAVAELREVAFSNLDLRGVITAMVGCESRDLRLHLSVALQTILLADHEVSI